MKKRFLAGLLTLAMLLTMAPVAFAVDGDTVVAKINDNTYTSLQEAINAAEDGDTIVLQKDGNGDGFTIPGDKFNNNGLIIDFDQHTYMIGGQLVGSPGTGSNGCQLNKDNKLTFKNGTFVGATEGSKPADDTPDWHGAPAIMIQNYSDLTLENMVVTGGDETVYTMSNNCGNIIIKDTTINAGKAKSYGSGPFAFDVYGGFQQYSDVTVSVEGNCVINGDIELSHGTSNNNKNTLLIKGGHINGAIKKVSGDISITGGTFSTDVSAYVADGYILNENGTVERLGETNAAAKVDDNYYKTLAEAIAAANGKTVTVLKDVEVSSTIKLVNTTCTIDLNNFTITGKSGDEGRRVFSVGNGANLTLSGKGTVTTAPVNTEGSPFPYNSSVIIVDSQPTSAKGNAVLTVGENVQIIAPASNGISVFGCKDDEAKPTVTVNGTVKTTADKDAAVIGNGSYGNVDITIGENANLSSEKSYAIYFPAAGKLTINGGEIIGDGGIEVKAGETVVSVSGDPIITATGTPSHAENNNGSSTEGYAIAVVNNANYDGDATVVIGSGYYKGMIDVVDDSNADINKQGSITITGGYFTNDPSEFCGTKDGKQFTGITNTDADTKDAYPWTVGVKGATAAPIQSSFVAPVVPEGVSEEVEDAIESMEGAGLTTSEAIEAATATEANNNTYTKDSKVDGKTVLEKLNEATPDTIIATADNLVIFYQTYLDVEVNPNMKTGTETDEENGTKHSTITEVTVNLTPKYRVLATTKDIYNNQYTEYQVDADGFDDTEANAIQLQQPQDLNLPNNKYEVMLSLPTMFAADRGDKVSVKHTKSTNNIEYYTGTIYRASAPCSVVFTTNGFSPFTISTAAAFIGETAYPTLQEAVDNVKNDEIINLAQDVPTDTKITVERTVSFTVNAKKSEGSETYNFTTGNIIAGTNTTVEANGSDAAGYTYKFTYSRPSSGSGSTSTTYAVNVNAATNGAVAADKKTAAKGTTVTVTATPSAGYVVDSVKVVDKDGKDVAVTAKDGKYVFTMPASAVTVTATFKAETPAPSGLPFTDVKSGDWFYDAVKYAYENGLMKGTSETIFAPNGTMNRAMIVTVLYRLEKSPAVTTAAKFTDVPAGQWYSDAVAWAAANNIVNGYDETTFGPLNAVTREQMAAILYRYEQYKGLENVTLEENLNRFPDKDKISSYAVPALQWAVGQKVINGNADGTLDPTGTATRAQVAQIFMNLLNK